MGNFEIYVNYTGYVFVGCAEGRFDATLENGTTEKRPFANMYVLSPVSDYVTEDYRASGFKAEKLKCATPTVWDGLNPGDRIKLFFDNKGRVLMAVLDDSFVSDDSIEDDSDDDALPF